MEELFRKVSDGTLEVRPDDIYLKTDDASFFIGEKIRSHAAFAGIWNNSDLPRIVGRFSELALNQYKHLAKNPVKTEVKIGCSPQGHGWRRSARARTGIERSMFKQPANRALGKRGGWFFRMRKKTPSPLSSALIRGGYLLFGSAKRSFCSRAVSNRCKMSWVFPF
jgi:hypothetical protein